MKTITIEDACALVTDGTHYTPPDLGEGVPFLTVKDLTPSGLDFENCSKISLSEYLKADLGNSSPKYGDVLFSKDGTVGKVHVVKESQDFAILSSVAILRPKIEILDSDYFGYVLNSTETINQAIRKKTGSAIRRIILKDLKNVRIPLPPLEEQKRIAAILDKADRVRRRQQEAIRLTEELGRSIFLDMFGDPIAQGWKMVKVGDVAAKSKNSMRTGPFGSNLLHSEFVDEGIPVLGIDNAVKNRFLWAKPRFITPEKYKQLKNYTVYPEDVIITIMGTCGRCAIIPDDCPTAINTKHLCCITTNKEVCLPEFLHGYFLFHPIAKQYFQRNTKGAIMDGLNQTIIKGLSIPLVPIDLQHQYKKAIQKLNAIELKAKNHFSSSENLFNSLLQRAFQGEL